MRRFQPVVSLAPLSLLLGGCMGTPTPLAPSLGGSIGVPHAGVQTEALELPRRGPGYVRYRPKSENYWGTPGLVRGLEEAARLVEEQAPGGAPMLVGDLSSKTGGKIPGHRSHRTGRDADLIYFAMTPTGAPVRTPGFVHYGSDGLAKVDGVDGGYLRLDVEREWLLVKALLQSPHTEVQWMFVSRNVEALLVDYARARGEDPYLVWRAETMLLEPGDSTNHDDHLHLRVACAPEDQVTGCEGGGPHWEWLSPAPALGELEPKQLSEIATDDPFDLSVVKTSGPRADDDV